MGKAALLNDKGQTMKEVPPALPWKFWDSKAYRMRRKFDIMENEIMLVPSCNRIDKARSEQAATKSSKVSLEELFQSSNWRRQRTRRHHQGRRLWIRRGDQRQLAENFEQQVKINVLHSAAGGITERCSLASASQAIIIGFNIRPETKARQLAESEHIEINATTSSRTD